MTNEELSDWADNHNKSMKRDRDNKKMLDVDDILDITPEQAERLKPTPRQVDLEYIAAYKADKQEWIEDEVIDHDQSDPLCFCKGCYRSVKERLSRKQSIF